MKYDTAQQWGVQTQTVMMLQSLRLECLYTEFLLHSLLASSSENNRERLITTAHEIVNLVLLPTRKRDLLHSHRADMEWAVSGEISERQKSGHASKAYTYRS